jgi:hypothetical protein
MLFPKLHTHLSLFIIFVQNVFSLTGKKKNLSHRSIYYTITALFITAANPFCLGIMICCKWYTNTNGEEINNMVSSMKITKLKKVTT